jgi:hypothetical protein
MDNAQGIPLNCGSISGANAPTYIFKKPTAGGDKIQLSVQPFARITSSSSSSNIVSYDATFLRSISAASITDYNTIVTKSDDIQSTSVYSLNSGVILGTISNGVASGVISGLSTASTYLVATAVGIPNCFSVASVNIDRVSSATIDSLVSYSSGTLAKNCYDAINNRITGKDPTVSKPIFSTLNHASSTYVRNTGCWAYDLDLTCISPWNSAGGITMGGTLISPCHIVFANHYQISNGSKIRYITSNNTIVERTVIDQAVVTNTDAQIGLLDSDVPSSISFAKILPSNWSSYLPNLYRNTQYNSNSAGLPVISLDYDKKASVMELHYVASDVSTYIRWPSRNSNFYSFLEMIIGGDSGSPSFLVINNQLVLISTWFSSIAGPFYGGSNINSINTVMNTLWTRNSRSGNSYTLTPIDLSGFTIF